MTAKELINIDSEIMGETRVPIQHLLDHIENNATIDEFLAGFPSVSKDQAIPFIHLMSQSVIGGKFIELNEDFA